MTTKEAAAAILAIGVTREQGARVLGIAIARSCRCSHCFVPCPHINDGLHALIDELEDKT